MNRGEILMVNDIIIALFEILDKLITLSGLFNLLSDLLDKLSVIQTYSNDIQYYLSGAYFFLGKPLIIFVISVATTCFLIKLIGALVMIIGQFIP